MWKRGLAADSADRLAGLKSASVALIPLDLEPCRHRQFRDLVVYALDHVNHGNSRDQVMPMSCVSPAVKIGPSLSPSLPRFAA